MSEEGTSTGRDVIVPGLGTERRGIGSSGSEARLRFGFRIRSQSRISAVFCRFVAFLLHSAEQAGLELRHRRLVVLGRRI